MPLTRRDRERRRRLPLVVTAVVALLAATFMSVAAAQAPTAQSPGPQGGVYVPMTPLRVLDSRVGIGRSGPLGPGESWDLVLGGGAVPSAATGVLLNMTATEGTAQTYLSLQPSTDPLLLTSNVNAGPGMTVANLVSVGLGTAGAVRIYNAAGTTHVVADLAGYFIGGAVGPQGPVGPEGAAGKTVHNGVGPPDVSLGAEGDFYIDTSTSTIYGPKTGGSWPPGASLVGADGTNGFSILNGSGAPLVTVGVDGDFYLDTSTMVLYGPKANSLWPGAGVSLVGKDGNTILNGTVAPTSTDGVDGDFYIDTTANVLYGPKAAGAWPLVGVSLVGPQGPPGGVGALYTPFTGPFTGSGTAASLVLPTGTYLANVWVRVSSTLGAELSCSLAGQSVGLLVNSDVQQIDLVSAVTGPTTVEFTCDAVGNTVDFTGGAMWALPVTVAPTTTTTSTTVPPSSSTSSSSTSSSVAPTSSSSSTIPLPTLPLPTLPTLPTIPTTTTTPSSTTTEAPTTTTEAPTTTTEAPTSTTGVVIP